MLSSTSTASFLVPTLLALAISLPLAAQDGLAPFITFPTDDPGLNLPEVGAKENSVSDPFILNNVLFTSGMYVWHVRQSYRYSTPFSGAVDTVQGIAVTAISGPGTWEYWSLARSRWVSISDVSEDSVLNIRLSEQLRFLPSSNVLSPSEATLTFRAVDDINVSGISTLNMLDSEQYGGDPTAFSAELRTLTVPILPVNDAPVWGNGHFDIRVNGAPLTYSTAYSDAVEGQTLKVSVAELVNNATSSDPDSSGSALVPGILLTGMDIDRFIFERSPSQDGVWTQLLPDIETNAVPLDAADWLRITTRSRVDATVVNAFTYHLWDGTDSGVAGNFIHFSDSNVGDESAFSIGYGQVDIVNARPVIDSVATVVINPDETTASFAVTAHDADGSVAALGTFDQQGVFQLSPVDVNGSHFEWDSFTAAPTITNTLKASNLTWSPGPSYYYIAAVDDWNVQSDTNYVTVYGNSTPVWDSVEENFSIDSRAPQPLSATFIVRDSDVDTNTHNPVWVDSLTTSVGAADSNRPLRGTVVVTSEHIPGQIVITESIRSQIIGNSPSSGYTNVTLTYTPDKTALISHVDDILIAVTDAHGLSASLPVHMAVGFVNHAPVITAPTVTDLGTVIGGTASTITASATDEDGGPLTWSVSTPAAHGTVTTNNAEGDTIGYTYTPAVGYSGSDSFTLQVADSAGLTAQLTFTSTVSDPTPPPVVNHPPVITAPLVTALGTMTGGQARSVTLTATDEDSATLTWTVLTAPAHGTVVAGNAIGGTVSYVYTPAVGYSGSDSFTLQVADSADLTAQLTFTSTVSDPTPPPVVNLSPVITAPLVTALGTVLGGTTYPISFSATDEDGGPLTWSVSTPAAHGTVTTNNAVGGTVSYTYMPALGFSGNDSFTVQVADSAGLTAQLTFTSTVSDPTPPPVVNHPPVITTPAPETSLGTLIGGIGQVFTAEATDEEGETLTWSVAVAPAHGAVTFTNAVGASVSYTYTPINGYSGADTFTLRVSDAVQAMAEVTVFATIGVNTPPVLVSTVGDGASGQGSITLLAIAGQSFEALFTGADAETQQDVQVTISGVTPDGLVFTASGTGRGALRGIPTTPGAYSFTLTLNDGVNSTSRAMSMTVVAPVLANVPPPVIPVSGPGNTVYASFLPGSSSNFQAVADILAGRPTSESRGFWWDETAGRYGELPALPSVSTRPWHALWLASVTPLTLPTEVPAVAMPYAIELVPGWTFFGIPPVTDGTTVSTAHGWANCSLQSAAGVPLSVLERAAVLGNADSEGPWAWNGTIYTRTTSLITGGGYWLYNRTNAPVRLVRGPTAAAAPILAQARAQAADNEQPPLPPHGAAANRAESSNGGNCGTGSGMGLFSLAGLLALMRFRRR
jgi:hypothetical protein